MHQPPTGGALSLALRRGTLACSEPACSSTSGISCQYVDRRQRTCSSAWCREHQTLAMNGVYCRRHAGIINALGPNHTSMTLPDLDNRAPSLANWVGRDLDGPIQDLLDREFPGHDMNVTTVVSGGIPRERTWGRSWKLISWNGVDFSINVHVPEADDSLVRVVYDGRLLAELTPPWIEARRHGVAPDPQTDAEARRRFYQLILDDLAAAVAHTKANPGQYRVIPT